MEHAKKIVADYLGITPESITGDTLINYKAVRGSIMLHRMYAALADSGVRVHDPASIRTYGDLVNAMTRTRYPYEDDGRVPKGSAPRRSAEALEAAEADALAIGIDIQDIGDIPVLGDSSSNSFFSDNFSEEEIAYCATQLDPRASFAARFALKEAIIKADNQFVGSPFNKLAITRNCQGAPKYPGFLLSCSHSRNQVVAVAVKCLGSDKPPAAGSTVTEEQVLRLLELESERHEKRFVMLNRRTNVMIALYLAVPVLYFMLRTFFGPG